MCIQEQFKADTLKEDILEWSTWTEIDPFPFLLPDELLSDPPCIPRLIYKFRLSVW